MIAFLVNPCIETTTAWKKPAYLEDDRMTPDTGRYSWKKHPKTLNANHLSIRCWNQQPWAHGFFLLVRNPNQKMYMWMFQVSNLISSWWTKSYTCSHRLIPQWSYNYFWMVSRTSPSHRLKKSSKNFFDTLEGLAKYPRKLLANTTGWSAGCYGKDCSVSAIAPFEARAPGGKLPATWPVSRRRKTTEKTSGVLVEKSIADIFREDTNGASMFLVSKPFFPSREIHLVKLQGSNSKKKTLIKRSCFKHTQLLKRWKLICPISMAGSSS